jgi:hypothetical protein
MAVGSVKFGATRDRIHCRIHGGIHDGMHSAGRRGEETKCLGGCE